MSKLMYCMNRCHALHNRVVCDTCLKQTYCMPHCPVQQSQLTQVPCSFCSKCRHIGSSLQIPHTSGQSRGSPCKRRYPSSVLHVLPSLSLAGPSMAEREGIECRPENLMPTPAMNVQCNPSLLHALQFAPAERTSTVQAASAQIMANERICNKIAQICNNPARSFTASTSLYVHSHAGATAE